MKRLSIAIIAGLAGCGPVENNPGPYPENYQAIVAEYIQTSFVDPPSVRSLTIEAPAEGRMMRHRGWIVCFEANARNSMGGYTGRKWTALLVRDGAAMDAATGTEIVGVCP